MNLNISLYIYLSLSPFFEMFFLAQGVAKFFPLKYRTLPYTTNQTNCREQSSMAETEKILNLIMRIAVVLPNRNYW